MSLKKNTGERRSFIFPVIILLISVALIFGAILGTVTAVKEARAVISYEGVRIKEGELNYLLSSYKYDFLSELNRSGVVWVEDTPEFFERVDADSGKTYGELLSRGAEEYVRAIAVGTYLFDRYSQLTAEDKREIRRAVEEKTSFVAGGDSSRFDLLGEKYGFDTDDAVGALTMIWKARVARSLIYGEDGSVLTLASYSEQREDFLNEYSHVRLLFVSTKHKYVLGDDGNYVEVDLDPDGQAEAVADIEHIRGLIEGYKTNSGSQMSPVAFKNYESKYLFIPDYIDGGYYFYSESQYSLDFEEKYPGVVKTALDLEVGEYGEVEWEEGICFIYKYAPDSGAYSLTVNEDFFLDFYSLASIYFYEQSLAALSPDVKVKEKYSLIDLIALPYNEELYCRI